MDPKSKLSMGILSELAQHRPILPPVMCPFTPLLFADSEGEGIKDVDVEVAVKVDCELVGDGEREVEVEAKLEVEIGVEVEMVGALRLDGTVFGFLALWCLAGEQVL